jgi:hypothetical protein
MRDLIELVNERFVRVVFLFEKVEVLVVVQVQIVFGCVLFVIIVYDSHVIVVFVVVVVE